MALSKITRNYQVTVPADIRKELNLEVGTIVDFEVVDNTIIITPKKMIDEDQEWFFTQEWQEDEKRADRDIAQGNITKTKNIDDLINRMKR